jgi:O-acetyl-ADP-ribose deacetylase (regulator of RNase III)
MPLEIVRNDITQMKVDAIVNAANNSLLGGGGVDGMIHRAAGPELLAECRTLNGCETGQAKITKGYRLPARYVIHTVGPVWHGGQHGERELLSSCYRNSLRLAAENGCESVAFPMISAGAYGYPKEQAMDVAVETVRRFLEEHDLTVYLVVFGREEFLTGKKFFRAIREYIGDAYAEEHMDRNVEYSRRMLWRRDRAAAMQADQALASKAAERFAEDEGVCDAPGPASQQPLPKAAPDWEKIVKRTDESFSEALLRLIAASGMTDVECYRKANVDRKLFSKIRSNPAYKPSKPTVCAFAVALELSPGEAQAFLRKAGFALSRSSRFDLILDYCFRHRFYNLDEINEVLFQYDLPLLGSGFVA